DNNECTTESCTTSGSSRVCTPTNNGLCVCGNGVVNPGEACDDGDTAVEPCEYGQASCTVCNSNCQLQPGATSYCGDGVIQNLEACDDGNSENGDGCSSRCAIEVGFTCPTQGLAKLPFCLLGSVYAR